MEQTICFRDFEERDIDFIYKCKNDEKLNSMIVGDYHPFSYEEAVKWVHGCMGEHETYKFWAVCTNDKEQRIVGWASLSQIDHINKTATFHGIVIADPDYHDGYTWINVYLMVYDYAFMQLGLESVYGGALDDNIQTQMMRSLMFIQIIEGNGNTIFRNGRFYATSKSVLRKAVYLEHKANGDYEIKEILKRVRNFKKK